MNVQATNDEPPEDESDMPIIETIDFREIITISSDESSDNEDSQLVKEAEEEEEEKATDKREDNVAVPTEDSSPDAANDTGTARTFLDVTSEEFAELEASGKLNDIVASEQHRYSNDGEIELEILYVELADEYTQTDEEPTFDAHATATAANQDGDASLC